MSGLQCILGDFKLASAIATSRVLMAANDTIRRFSDHVRGGGGWASMGSARRIELVSTSNRQ